MPSKRRITAVELLQLLSPIIGGLESLLEDLVIDTYRLVRDLIRAFPNVPRMIDLWTRYTTSLIGRALAVPWRSMERVFIGVLRRENLHNRVIRLDRAFEVIFRSLEEYVQAWTFTDETGILAVMANRWARWLWRITKKFRLLSILIRKGQDEFAEAVVNSLIRKGRLIWYAALVLGIILSFAVFALPAVAFGLSLQFLKGEFHRAVLPQDSARSWRKKGGVARRNVRRGPDTNPQ